VQFGQGNILSVDGVHGEVYAENKAAGMNATVAGYGATAVRKHPSFSNRQFLMMQTHTYKL
jgi:hypothetical protein